MSDTIRVEFTAHAEEQIAARKMDRAQIIAVATAPEQVVSEPGKPLVAQSRIQFKGKTFLLRVAFHDEGDVRLVITVYRTSQVRRYWQEEAQ